jgi:hypothetical protein
MKKKKKKKKKKKLENFQLEKSFQTNLEMRQFVANTQQSPLPVWQTAAR